MTGDIALDSEQIIRRPYKIAEDKDIARGDRSAARRVGLVNTVGAFRPGDALATTPETLRLMLDVHLGPALWLSQAVAPQLINTASNRDRGQSGTRTSGHMRCLAGSGAGRKSLGAQSLGLSVAFRAFPLVELA